MTEENSGSNDNRIWETLKVIGTNLPDLFKNYNYLLTLAQWTDEQQKAMESFVFHLVLVIRSLQESALRTTSHPWKRCLEVLQSFEEAIRDGVPVEQEKAIALNHTFQAALIEWDEEKN
jgi:hypothetical protein